jgi:hypothetical protein
MDNLICYCFKYSKEDIKRDYQNNGRSQIMERILIEKKYSRCQCTTKNPKGRWCLPDVRQVVDGLKSESSFWILMEFKIYVTVIGWSYVAWLARYPLFHFGEKPSIFVNWKCRHEVTHCYVFYFNKIFWRRLTVPHCEIILKNKVTCSLVIFYKAPTGRNMKPQTSHLY